MSEVAKARLFEYVAIEHPELDDNGKPKGKSKIVVPVTQVLAMNDKEVGVIASRALPEEVLDHLERVDITIRPF